MKPEPKCLLARSPANPEWHTLTYALCTGTPPQLATEMLDRNLGVDYVEYHCRGVEYRVIRRKDLKTYVGGDRDS